MLPVVLDAHCYESPLVFDLFPNPLHILHLFHVPKEDNVGFLEKGKISWKVLKYRQKLVGRWSFLPISDLFLRPGKPMSVSFRFRAFNKL